MRDGMKRAIDYIGACSVIVIGVETCAWSKTPFAAFGVLVLTICAVMYFFRR